MPLSDLEFRRAGPPDEPAIRALLSECGLPSADVSSDRQELLLALSVERIVGCVGLELHGAAVLLRSFAVAPAWRRRGLGAALHDRILAAAALHGASTAYLLTSTTEGFCAARGFERVDRSAVPPEVAASEQFRGLCPATAICMRRRLDGEARHYPADVLQLRPDVPGARMWAVALQHAMLTCFEVAPGASFETHRHESEQITLVLEGELFFQIGDGPELRVSAGEVIAVPGDAPHRVWSGARAARAVDAWSPVRAEYLR